MQIGLGGVLGVVFVILKLTGYIDWSWWWVTAPFWISFLLSLVLFTAVFAIQIFGGSPRSKRVNRGRR
jgi:hypothetical protein